MDSKDREKIKSISDLPSLINFSQRFFPDLNPTKNSTASFEESLWNVFFRIVEKITVFEEGRIVVSMIGGENVACWR